MKPLRRFVLRLFDLVCAVTRRFAEDNGLRIAASLTFTTLLALVPMITVALTLMTAIPVLQDWPGVIEDWVFANMVPESADAIQAYADEFVDNAANLTLMGMTFLAVTAILLLLTIDDAFNHIWRVRKPRPALLRTLIYVVLIAVAPVLLGASLILSSWLLSASAGWTENIPQVQSVLIKGSVIMLTCLALSLLYYGMPNCRVKFAHALAGGALAGVVFETAKHGFGFYVTQFPTYKLVYGAFAAVPMFLLWLYVSWLVVLLGAVVVAVLPAWCEPDAAPPPGTDD
jgi:membrane protein